ncbi:AMP11, partial [Enterospora canceri]
MSRVKLSNEVTPSHYDLTLNVEDTLFSGVCKIVCNALKSITTFEFNTSSSLNLERVQIYQNQKEIGCKYEVSKEEAKKDEFVTVKLEKPVSSNFQVVIKYKGKYGNLDGFYRKEDGDKNVLFSTQFEPADARKAFPCFDQPDLKAALKLTINCPAEYMALGNGKIEKDEVKEGKRSVTFETTPRMSTYIMAWVIGKLDYIEKKDSSVTIRVYAYPKEKEWGRYALDVAYDCLKLFETYFDIKYPLPKVDLVSIPSFASGAMENWGLITFRRTSILFNPETSFIRSKKIIANTVCHELAHMWFGNLVTMTWWNDLWLNEGFATWAASMALREIGKANSKLVDWNEESNFASSDIEGGMLADCLENTHKIAVEVRNPEEVDQIFDAISYDKGSSVIKMLEGWMGANLFREGIRSYLKEKAYENAETSDLWEHLNKKRMSDSIAISSLMTHWIDRDGFPGVTITDAGEKVVLRQSRFTKGYTKEDKPWAIPLQIRWMKEDGTEEVEKILFDSETLSITKRSRVFKLNDGMNSFIRVKYDRNTLVELLKTRGLSATNRLNLIADMFEYAFALRGELMTDVLELFSEEKNFEVMENILMNLQMLKSAFYDTPEMFNRYKEMQNTLIEKRLEMVDLNNAGKKNVNDLALDSLIVTVGVANEIYSVDEKNVHQEFVKNYFVSQVDKSFEEIKEFYETSDLPGVKESALMALGKTKKMENFN